MVTKGFNFALDFTGGIGVELPNKAPDVDRVREQLDAAGFGGAQVQNFGSGNDLLVRLQAGAPGKRRRPRQQHRRRGGQGGVAGRQPRQQAQQLGDQRPGRQGRKP